LAEWDANCEFTKIRSAQNSTAYGLKYWILAKYRYVCKTYDIVCDETYLDENYAYTVDKEVEVLEIDSMFANIPLGETKLSKPVAQGGPPPEHPVTAHPLLENPAGPAGPLPEAPLPPEHPITEHPLLENPAGPAGPLPEAPLPPEHPITEHPLLENPVGPLPEGPLPEAPLQPEHPITEHPLLENPVDPVDPVGPVGPVDPVGPLQEAPLQERPITEHPFVEKPIPIPEAPLPERPIIEDPLLENPVGPLPEAPLPVGPLPEGPLPENLFLENKIPLLVDDNPPELNSSPVVETIVELHTAIPLDIPLEGESLEIEATPEEDDESFEYITEDFIVTLTFETTTEITTEITSEITPEVVTPESIGIDIDMDLGMETEEVVTPPFEEEEEDDDEGEEEEEESFDITVEITPAIISEDMFKIIPEDIPEADLPEDVPEDVPEDIPEDVPEAVSEETSEKVSAIEIKCLGELLNYPCCEPRVTDIYEIDNYGEWSYDFDLMQWCSLTPFNGTVIPDPDCWSEPLGYRCCRDCHVYYTDALGHWGYDFRAKEWCGRPSYCPEV